MSTTLLKQAEHATREVFRLLQEKGECAEVESGRDICDTLFHLLSTDEQEQIRKLECQLWQPATTLAYTNDVYELAPEDEVSCIFCPRSESYRKGEAYLAGPGHSPCDGNANYVCRGHLDSDAVICPNPLENP